LSDPRIVEKIHEIKADLQEYAAVKRSQKIGLIVECIQDVRKVEDKTFAHYAMIMECVQELNKMDGEYAPIKTSTTSLNANFDAENLQALIKKHRREF